MRQALAKKLFAGSIAAVTALLFGLMPATIAFAQSFPTMKVTGGDVSAGGWFGDNCNQSGNPYQDAAYTGGGITDHSAGGIYTYSGTSSDYAAYALGVIDKTSGSAPNGFNSSAAKVGAQDRLSFANIDYLGAGGGYIGGNWDGGVPNIAQCIPDYFADKAPSGLSPSSLPVTGNQLSGVTYYTGSDGGGNTAVTFSASDITVNDAADIVVIVDGSVYINHNIKYAGYNVTNIPRFVLVAAGNIYVDPGVTQLDGLYIAQPNKGKNPFEKPATVSDPTGEFWTCHGPTGGQIIDSTFLNTCQNTLTVNGAVIAKRVNLLRVNGSNSPRETFNYTPAMVLGGPFFPGSESASGSTTGQPVFDSIITLPPVF